MGFTNEAVLTAFLLTLIAGLSTGIGSAISLLRKGGGKNWLTIALGFSAGVMIYVSFMEILPHSFSSLCNSFGEAGHWYGLLSFFGGVGVILIIDKLVPNIENPHEPHFTVNEFAEEHSGDMAKLKKMGVLTALAIAIHNFPEGIAVFSSALVEPEIGLSIAIAIAIHNIPEGIAVSVPIYYATKSRKQAFWLSFLSGLSEPVGALIGFTLMRSFLNEATLGIIFGMTAGIMIFISLDELLPTAKKYDKGHAAIYSILAGMAVMAISLLLLGPHQH
jgi:ZIP family zinc transporter